MTDDDENESRRVVVLGVESRDQLFPGKAAIGETLMMNGSPYTVIGVLEKKSRTAAMAAVRQHSAFCSLRIDGARLSSARASRRIQRMESTTW